MVFVPNQTIFFLPTKNITFFFSLIKNKLFLPEMSQTNFFFEDIFNPINLLEQVFPNSEAQL